MASLYKRYIPPKQSLTTSVSESTNKSTAKVQIEAVGRKRVRTEDELAQRKAKKLKQKGVQQERTAEPSGTTVNLQASEVEATAEAPQRPRSEFAHIKNIKKRHKLEKEARRARKETEKGGASQQVNGDFAVTDVRPPSRTSPQGNEEQDDVDSKRRRPGHSHSRSAASPIQKDTSEVLVGNPEDQLQHSDATLVDGVEAASDLIEAARIEPSVGEAASLTTQPQPKKRRHKLEAVLEQDRSHASEEDIERLEKHGGVLNKFQKSTKLGRLISQKTSAPVSKPFEAPKVQDLVIPYADETIVQGDNAASVLPQWLAKPTIVSSRQTVPFSALNIANKTTEHLSKLGFTEALPVQQALIPLLLPPGSPGSAYLAGTKAVTPDVAVSAPTGSGKTIAYLVPLLESLKSGRVHGKLSALVVVPTRELVVQVAAVSETLTKGTNLKIGTATGAGSLRDEQSKLVSRSRSYDATRYKDLMCAVHTQNHPSVSVIRQPDDTDGDIRAQGLIEERETSDAVTGLVDHIPIYGSAVDVLIATPGRLLEHIAKSPGFSLAHLQWLVLDEADKLLDQQYGGLLNTINEQISRPLTRWEQDPRQQYLSARANWDERAERRTRKVMLSATMTRDISKLAELKLKRPQLVVVRGNDVGIEEVSSLAKPSGALDKSNDNFELPPTLHEYSVHIGNGDEKPLYLVELLRKKILVSGKSDGNRPYEDDESSEDESDSDSTSSSDDSSDTKSDAQAPSSESSDADSDEESTLSSAASNVGENEETPNPIHPERAAMLADFPSHHANNPVPTVLIFTSSTEAANRLSYLLKSLLPDTARHIATMTRTSSKRAKTHPQSGPADPVITVATDRAGRGLDAIGNRTITHVVQYDVPRSVTSYVHRVGRTARAGRSGQAWTLFSHSEARWFLNQIARAKSIRRAAPVEKAKVEVVDEALRDQLNEALSGMRADVFGQRKA